VTYEELLALGRAMGPDEKRASLEALARDPRFPALVALVREAWESYADSGSTQRLATHDGCLQHCAGSMWALRELEGRLRSLLHLKESQGPVPPPDAPPQPRRRRR